MREFWIHLFAEFVILALLKASLGKTWRLEIFFRFAFFSSINHLGKICWTTIFKFVFLLLWINYLSQTVFVRHARLEAILGDIQLLRCHKMPKIWTPPPFCSQLFNFGSPLPLLSNVQDLTSTLPPASPPSLTKTVNFAIS